MSATTSSRRFVRANLVVATGTGLSRITGFGRVAALAYALGQTSLTDTYNLANTMPNVVYELLLGGILTTTLVPVFVSHLDKGDEESTDAVVTVAVAVLLALTVVAVLAAPLIVHLYTVRVPAADVDAIREEATTLARFFLPQITFYGITSLGIALLNSRRRFAAAAFAPVLNNVIVIAALVALPHVVNGDITLDSALGNRTVTLLLGLGTTAGIIAMTSVVWIAVGRSGIHIHPRFLWRHPAVREVARLSGWSHRLCHREPGGAAGRVDPRVAGRRRALRLPSRVHLLPAPPRSPRGHVHHDVRSRARRVRDAGVTTTPIAIGCRSACGSSLW